MIIANNSCRRRSKKILKLRLNISEYSILVGGLGFTDCNDRYLIGSPGRRLTRTANKVQVYIKDFSGSTD